MAINNFPFTNENAALTVVETLTQTITASDQQTGTGYGTVQNSTTISKSVSVGNTAGSPANNVANGADLVHSRLYSIAVSPGTVSINLKSLYDILGQSVAFARIKSLRIRLLSPTDDATNGTNASSIAIGGATHPFLGPLSAGTITLNTGDEVFFRNVSAAGWAVTLNSNDTILITNNDGSNAAVVQVTVVGGSS